ncbi:inositol 1,4,5-trisphosphate receptor-interacting protein [Centroberyx affinis]|uniref:inositol 1,4,5-trisphosphate receptor-interacting protein n=1 Tax=Centroberyx affinis TaxID=166261 RepID=UPI003A5C062E
MQDILLRVFVVALGLIMHPKEDPRVEQWDDIIAVGMREHEERLLREGEKLDQDMTPISREMTHADAEGPQLDLKNIHEEPVSSESDQHVAQTDNLALVEDVTLTTNEHSEEEDNADHKLSQVKSDPSLPREDEREPETDVKTSQVEHEHQPVAPHAKGHLKLSENDSSKDSKEREDIQASGSFTDPSISQGQQERIETEEVSISQQEVPLSHLHTETSEEEDLGMTIADWEKDYLWYLWNTISIISMIRFFGKYLRRNSHRRYGEDDTSEHGPFPVNCISAEVPLPDSDTLQRFHSKCIQDSSSKRWREVGFLEGFANDLLKAMKTMSGRNGGMIIEDFQMVEDVCEIIVSFTPPEPYSFQCQLWSNQTSDMLPDMPVCGKIKMVENVKIQNGCHCESSDIGDDVVCLLHCESKNVKAKMTDVYDGLLCMKNTPFLSKSQVTKWFQSAIRQAWALISHKYEFELNFRNIDAPGALVVRFRSGKKMSFNMNPVVKLNRDAHFFITPHSTNNLDTFWTLSVTAYEDRLLHHLSKSLPQNSCHIQTLEIVHFLHKRQTALTGSSALKDSHFKTTLMHLLLTKAPSQWHPDYIASRLRDLLVFVEKSLQQKLLHHSLIGNPSTQNDIELPVALSQAKPVNLFHPLVVHDCLYTNAVMHFQEMLKNTHMLIQDYVPSKM